MGKILCGSASVILFYFPSNITIFLFPNPSQAFKLRLWNEAKFQKRDFLV